MAHRGDDDLKSDTGTRWWQPGSEFDRWLCARVRRPMGGGLDSKDILRFIWSGENHEPARDNAAAALFALIRPLEAAGRPISIIAHGHGGDVARRACEMAAISGSSAPPWSVVCIGTPFYHHGLAPRLRAIAIRLVLFLFWAASLWLAPQWLAAHFLQIGIVWYALIIGLLALNSLCQLLLALRELDVRRHFTRSRFAARGVFTNLCSRRDEALALLQSLNPRVRLMRQREPYVWFLTGFGFLFAIMFAPYALGTVIMPFVSLAGFAPFATVVEMGEALLLLLGVAAAMSLFYPLADALIDLAITARTRGLAYGNDCAAAITGVERFPWPHAEASAVPLSARIEKALEAFTVAHDIPRRVARAPGTPLFIPDIRAMVDRTLAGDDLTHNAYFRIEPFADLVAASLEKSGQWQRVRAPVARTARSPSRQSEEDGN